MNESTMPALPLGEAFDRLEDFLAVWADGITPEAVECLQESVGIDAGLRRLLATRLRHLQPHAAPGAVLLGLLLGLSAAECATGRCVAGSDRAA